MKFLIIIFIIFPIKISNANTRIYFSAGGNLYNSNWTWLGTANTDGASQVTPKLFPSIALSSPTITNYSAQISGFLTVMADGAQCNPTQDIWIYPRNNPIQIADGCGTWGLFERSIFQTSYINTAGTPVNIQNTIVFGGGNTSPPQYVNINTKINSPVIFTMMDEFGNWMMGTPSTIREGVSLFLTSGPNNLGRLKFIFSGQIDIQCASCTPGQFLTSGGILYVSSQTPGSGFKQWTIPNNQVGAIEREEYIPINFSNARF